MRMDGWRAWALCRCVGRASPTSVRFDAQLERAFDELVRRAGAPEGAGKAWLPFVHLSTTVRGRSPMWSLTHREVAVQPAGVGSRRAFVAAADGASFRRNLAAFLVTAAGRAAASTTERGSTAEAENPRGRTP
jgi:hypothetical protein